jgi:hypothetical protein
MEKFIFYVTEDAVHKTRLVLIYIYIYIYIYTG